MSKRFWNILFLFIITVSCFAMPAKRGVYKMITLADGTQVRAELRGDEHVSFWQIEDGQKFVKDEATEYYVTADIEKMNAEYQTASQNIQPRVSTQRRTAGEQPSDPVVGDRKGLIVLVQFQDVSFQEDHDKAFYEKIVNQKNYKQSPFVGSVRDYFSDQSDGQLDYTFDIVGPITLSHEYSYYGANSTSRNDKNMKYFVTQSLNAIKDSVNFSKYDNDDDGWVDNVFFVYAGHGENDSGDENTIWPHMYYLYSGYYSTFRQNGVQVDVYACSNEVQANNAVNGIGTICHEFSHCLGLPDMYDTSYGGSYGTASWDLMDAGGYNGNSYRPAGYNAYERDFLGWTSLKDLTEEGTYTLSALTDGGYGYKLVNPNHTDEYFIVEARNTTGWDTKLPGTGLLIYHVDYDFGQWVSNSVNTITGDEDHQRMAIVAADNSYTTSGEGGDAYPYKANSAFSDKTTPAATLFNLNTDDTYNFGKSLYDIKRNDDGTVTFSLMKGTYVYDNNAPEGSMFYESFGRCAGTGGNDGAFSGSVGMDDFVADNDAWTASNKFGGYKCAKFGTNRQNGTVTSPEFTLTGPATLTFKAASYASECSGITLSVASGNATLAETSFKIAKAGAWSEFSTNIEGTGAIKLKFAGTKRWFLDEVLVMPEDPSGINDVTVSLSQGDNAIYNLSGQKVNADYKGVVIVNGKKIYRF